MKILKMILRGIVVFVIFCGIPMGCAWICTNYNSNWLWGLSILIAIILGLKMPTAIEWINKD